MAKAFITILPLEVNTGSFQYHVTHYMNNQSPLPGKYAEGISLVASHKLLAIEGSVLLLQNYSKLARPLDYLSCICFHQGLQIAPVLLMFWHPACISLLVIASGLHWEGPSPFTVHHVWVEFNSPGVPGELCILWASDCLRDGHKTQIHQIRLNAWTLAGTIEKEQDPFMLVENKSRTSSDRITFRREKPD